MENLKEKEIMETNAGYLIFMDEVGESCLHNKIEDYDDPSRFPVMSVVAFIVSKDNYENILIPGLFNIKKKFFNDGNVYFHSREIRRKDGIFKIFLNDETYTDFKKDINSLIEKSSIVIISSSINKLKLLEKVINFEKLYGLKYDEGDIYIKSTGYLFERLGHFLNLKRKNGQIVFETRGKNESKKIQAMLTDVKANGNFYCQSDRFSFINDKIMFRNKKDNICGLQIVDYITYPFARHSKNPKDTDNKFFDFLRRFVYQGDYGEYGLKEWP